MSAATLPPILQPKPAPLPFDPSKLKPTAIIVDIDGCICLPEVMSTDWDWDDIARCQRAQEGCKPNWPMISLVNFLCAKTDSSVKILLVTTRPERDRSNTVIWMQRHKVRYDDLIMRPTEDRRHDVAIKRGLVQKITGDYEVWFVIEDRTSCVDMFRELGHMTFQCAKGDY